MSDDPVLTINDLFDASCERYQQHPAVSFAFQPPISYADMREEVLKVAGALKAKGIGRGDRVAILAENSPRWGISYLGVIRAGAVVVPILPDFPESDVLHILPDAGVETIFTTGKQVEKISELPSEALKLVVTLDDSKGPGELQETTTYSELLALGADETADPSRVESSDLASIIYTSGTSGHSKAVMLTHGNFCANVTAISQVVDISPDWCFLSVLPISHTYEFTVGFLLPIYHGARVVYCDRRPTPTILEKICTAERPTVMCVVPMIVEKIYKKKILPVIKNSRVIPLLLNLPFVRKKILARISRKLRDFFGGELRLMAIGGAALNLEAEKFFNESGFPYIVGYGMTETSPLLTAGPVGDPTVTVGSCGKPIPGVEIKIVRPQPDTGVGEIFCRGANVMKGYYENPVLTGDTIDSEGWLATGDLGRLDERNNLTITGRSKSLIVLSHGENVYPEAVEEKINSSIYVAESLVTESGDKLIATIFPDYECIDLETTGQSQQEKLEHIQKILKKVQMTVNQQLPAYSQIHQVVERQEPFIKTATQKIKRYLYSPQG